MQKQEEEEKAEKKLEEQFFNGLALNQRVGAASDSKASKGGASAKNGSGVVNRTPIGSKA